MNLIDRENLLKGNLLYVRQCYKDIINLPIWDQENIFFTGTPGIGKTVFRNYVIGAQIQKLKAEKGDGIFVLGKSPIAGSQTYVMQMVKGSIDVDSIKDCRGNISLG